MDHLAENAFVLDEDCGAVLVERTVMKSRWTEFPHAHQRERGLVMVAGERLKLPSLRAPPEPVLWMRCLRGVPEISQDGLDVEIWLSTDHAPSQLLLSQRLDNGQSRSGLREIIFDLPISAASHLEVEVHCEAGPKGDPRADWLGLTGLVVCARGDLALNRARSQRAWRLENEMAHFSQVYSGEFYRDRHIDRSAGGATIGALRPLPEHRPLEVSDDQMRAALRKRLSVIIPQPGEQAFGYSLRMLGMLMPQQPPNFAARLREISSRLDGRPLRMLSLCAGEAAIEGSLLAQAGIPVELCIVDVNAGLLEQAALRMPARVTVDRVLGDANDIGPQLGQFDLINITSGLHHLVELERVLGAIADLLLPGGEFWLIGEQIGRNGNQLWPEANEAAQRIFASWPADKRMNRNTGKLDDALPTADFSAGCFEGIRSQDILGLLERYFLPIDSYQRNAFLWRLVDVAYSANFNLELPSDRDLLMDATVEEAMHWARGGRGTEMHAVYRSKWADVTALAMA